MSVLASALNIGDTQARLNVPLSGVGSGSFNVKIDDELLHVGGVENRTGLVLAMSFAATESHAQGATVTPVLDAFTTDATSPFATGGGDPGEQTVQSVVVNLDAADIATLSSVPVQVVAAPGAGTVIVPVSASFQYVAGATAFDATAVLALRLATNPVLEGDDPGFDFSDDSLASFAQITTGMTLADVANEPLTLTCDLDPDGAGDGTARLQVLYYVMDLA